MFTGIVEDRGVVAALEPTEAGTRLTVTTRLSRELAVGASVAVNGVCLTVVARDDVRTSFDVVPETLDRSNLGTLRPGSAVNLERPTPADGRFDGHIVQGHVDGRAIVAEQEIEDGGVRLVLQLEPHLLRYVVEKGSITVDGVSLTVASVSDDGVDIALIPHTMEVTTLGDLAPGAAVNIEVDVIAKYVERLLGARA